MIPEELLSKWNDLTSDLKQTLPVSLPRAYLSELTFPLKSATLCGFCDASTKVYAAMVYIVLKTKTECASQFIAVKTRVAPLQGQTVAQLELLSTFLLSKLVSSVHLGCCHQDQNGTTLRPDRCPTGTAISIPPFQAWVHGI